MQHACTKHRPFYFTSLSRTTPNVYLHTMYSILHLPSLRRNRISCRQDDWCWSFLPKQPESVHSGVHWSSWTCGSRFGNLLVANEKPRRPTVPIWQDVVVASDHLFYTQQRLSAQHRSSVVMRSPWWNETAHMEQQLERFAQMLLSLLSASMFVLVCLHVHAPPSSKIAQDA